MAKHKIKKDKTRIKMKIIIFVLCLVVFLYSGINLLIWAIDNNKSASMIDKIKKENTNIQNGNANPIDFVKLKDQNPDVVGWIKIEGTQIDYPIVQTNDNEYYLHKDIDKKANKCGWIFMDYMNSNKFIDMNTVIYGHNLKSGLMFADLNKIVNDEIKDITIQIYTQDKKIEYKVFSSYIEKPGKYSVKSSITDETEQQKYIKEMLEKSKILYNVVPDKSDKLLTLSTCDNSGKNRILVHAVNLKEEGVER